MAIAIGNPPERVEVDLWGATFHTRRVTRSVAKALEQAQKDIQERSSKQEDDFDPDAMLKAWGDMLDVILEPEQGKRKKASAHITERWEADDLTLAEVEDFIGRLAEASRPT